MQTINSPIGGLLTLEIPRHTSPDNYFELLWLECPTRLARGTSRDVYEIPGHEDKVLKISNCQANFSNWMEILVYSQFKDGGELAEMISWSWSGRFVVMERLSPLGTNDPIPPNLTPFLTDRKPVNYGRDASGKIKALDYAALAIATPWSDFV